MEIKTFHIDFNLSISELTYIWMEQHSGLYKGTTAVAGQSEGN